MAFFIILFHPTLHFYDPKWIVDLCFMFLRMDHSKMLTDYKTFKSVINLVTFKRLNFQYIIYTQTNNWNERRMKRRN